MGSQFVEVQTKQGAVRGQVKQSLLLDGHQYCAFLGIPYGKPPVGHLRFKAPEPAEPWEGVRDALKDGNSCVQVQLKVSFRFPPGDEDCLYLNVYTHKLPTPGGQLSPVMVFIHGGGYVGGSGSSVTNGPDIFMQEDIVLVTINFRSGALGFLSLETKEVPGNAGLKDQTLALRWVKDNITSFGGDGDNVTIFGVSSGGASVQYHLLSPLSRGLFHRTIIQSGFSFNPWAFQPRPLQTALRLARELGCSSQDPQQVLQYLQSLPALEIAQAQFKIATEEDAKRRYGFLFAPCVEGEGEGHFLTATPRTLMEDGRFTNVPVMMGVSDKEGLVNIEFHKYGDEEFAKLNANPKYVLPLEAEISSQSEAKAAEEVLEFYLKGKKISWDTTSDYFDLVGDLSFNLGLERTRAHLVRHSSSPVFLYQFSYCSDRRVARTVYPSVCPQHGEHFLSLGAGHADEMALLFASTAAGPFVLPSARDRMFMAKITKAWTTFAKTGDPNCQELGVRWRPDTQDRHHFVDMDDTWTLVTDRMFNTRMHFWDQFFSSVRFAY